MAVAEPTEAGQQSEDFWQIDDVIGELNRIRHETRKANARNAEFGSVGFPSRYRVQKLMEDLCGVLFPLRLGPDHVRPHNEDQFVTQTLRVALSRLQAQIRLELAYHGIPDKTEAEAIDRHSSSIVAEFARQLPRIRTMLDLDIEAAFRGDPAARSLDEVLICYPGLLAIIHHRLAHLLGALGAPLVARIISEIAHGQTGIDIHPGAHIGAGLFIDHGTGVVIGETAIIGRNVRLYQGVTLGAKSFATDQDGLLLKSMPRHPIIEDDVVIYSGATILGRVVIGRGSEIGGNVWLTHGVPPYTRVLQAPEQNHTITALSQHHTIEEVLADPGAIPQT
ncbi:serine O-acetyltransferase EpsC [Tsuneonella sp. HG222]